jgi:hypothetical protein
MNPLNPINHTNRGDGITYLNGLTGAVSYPTSRSDPVFRLVGKLRELATTLGLAVALGCVPILVIMSLYAGLLLSLEVPRRFVDSGVEEFEGAKREEARRFLRETEFVLNEDAMVPSGALRVESVKKCPPDAEPGDPIDGPQPGRVRLPYSVVVREYGPFGIPMRPIRWHCGGTATRGERYLVSG